MLRAGVDRAEREIKKLPKDLKELSKYKAYELVVVNFKESLPVIVNLKNDAVKQARARRFVEVPSFDATRLMVWVVSLSILGRFGPRRGHRRGVGSTRSRRWRRAPRPRRGRMGVDASRATTSVPRRPTGSSSRSSPE